VAAAAAAWWVVVLKRCLWCTSSVFVGPAASAQSTSTASPSHETAKLVAIAAGVVVVVVVVAVVLACGVACRYRRLHFPMSLFVVDGRRGVRKRRVVVMHSNSLYDGDAVTKQQQLHPHQLAFLTPPRVKVETLSGRSNQRRLLSTVFEYEIPLDPQWEFPRDKSAALNLFAI